MITEDMLIADGYKEIWFAHEIGGGEDEDHSQMFCKDGVCYCEMGGIWYKAKQDGVNYINGFPTDNPQSVIELD